MARLTKIIVEVMVAQDVLLAIGYAVQKDWPRTLYWLLAAGLCAVVPFIK